MLSEAKHPNYPLTEEILQSFRSFRINDKRGLFRQSESLFGMKACSLYRILFSLARRRSAFPSFSASAISFSSGLSFALHVPTMSAPTDLNRSLRVFDRFTAPAKRAENGCALAFDHICRNRGQHIPYRL